MDYRNFIEAELKKASKVALATFGKVSAKIKPEDKNQVLTKTDLEISKLLIKHIKKIYPEYNVIDEEHGVIDNGSDYTWVTDPIDGTSNFANGVPTYGIMIGLLYKSIPIAGGISLPYFKELYIAEKNKGTFCNGARLHVTKNTKLSMQLVSYGIDGHQENPDLTRKECELMADIILNIRNLRISNCVFDTVMVAKGLYGGVLNKTSRIWDNVAQQIVIEEAGGLYTDFFGKRIDYSNPLTKVKENFTLCAAAPDLHSQLQEIIHRSKFS